MRPSDILSGYVLSVLRLTPWLAESAKARRNNSPERSKAKLRVGKADNSTPQGDGNIVKGG